MLTRRAKGHLPVTPILKDKIGVLLKNESQWKMGSELPSYFPQVAERRVRNGSAPKNLGDLRTAQLSPPAWQPSLAGRCQPDGDHAGQHSTAWGLPRAQSDIRPLLSRRAALVPPQQAPDLRLSGHWPSSLILNLPTPSTPWAGPRGGSHLSGCHVDLFSRVTFTFVDWL